MRTFMKLAAAGLVLSVGLVTPAVAADCPDDSVRSGTVCIDKYEASLWFVPPEKRSLIGKIQKGDATLADLTGGGAQQLGLASGDLAANGCPVTGNDCVDVYAVSIPGVAPAGFQTWFQAVAAARNSLKRLPTSQEWLAAAMGTPDGATCNVGPDDNYPDDPDAVPAFTGSQPGCVSNVGAFDMVGNLWERVADWANTSPAPPTCVTQSPTFGDDQLCGGGPTATRGGFFGPVDLGGGTHAGVFAFRANFNPHFAPGGAGFRGIR